MSIGLVTHLRIYPLIHALPLYLFLAQGRQFLNWRSIRFGLISGGLFIGLFIIFDRMYPKEFAWETYFYHFSRKDHRHNVSIFWVSNWLNT
jgi:hypothetical protein